MWFGISSWFEQKCRDYCSQSIYNTLYDYFGWSQFQSLPTRCLQQLSQFVPTSVGNTSTGILICSGAVLITAASLYYAKNRLQKEEPVDIKIDIKYSRGFHDSSMDFPPNGEPKHDMRSSKAIVLDFGNKIFTLPRNFMLYIDDVESLGFSWLPPKEFIDCVNEGYRKPHGSQKPTEYDIGFLVKLDRFVENDKLFNQSNLQDQNPDLNAIYDSHGTDQNVYNGSATKVETRNTLAVDEITLKRLKRIMQLVDAKEDVLFNRKKL